MAELETGVVTSWSNQRLSLKQSFLTGFRKLNHDLDLDVSEICCCTMHVNVFGFFLKLETLIEWLWTRLPETR